MSIYKVLWTHTKEDNLQIKRQKTEELYTLLITVTALHISSDSSKLIAILQSLFGVSCTSAILSHLRHDLDFFNLVVSQLRNGTETDPIKTIGER